MVNGIEKTNAAHLDVRGFHQIWWKLLATYLVVAAVCLGIVILIIRQISLNTYGSHISHMQGAGLGGMMSGPMMLDLNSAFNDAIDGAVIWGGLIAVLVAMLLSLIISRRITRPIHDMAVATQSIAEGDYSQRVEIKSEDEIGTLAHSLNDMAESLEESQKLRRELMANIAHELRTPLTSISGYMEGLEDGIVPATTETYGLVRHEAARLARMVEDLQRLSRAESGREKLDIVSIDTGPFLDRMVKKMLPQYRSKKVDLDLAADGTPALLADEDKLDQVIVNLLDNALRYTEPNGQVNVKSAKAGNLISIEISDNGIGIGADDLAHIFERFYRTDKSRARSSGGTGIGLTIVKRYVELLGGKIFVESSPGKGTRFTVLFPAA